MTPEEIAHWVFTAALFAAYEYEHWRNNRTTRALYELLASERGVQFVDSKLAPIDPQGRA